ncbi:MAG: recombination regulator RecX [Pseudomonadota bacterium]
MRYLARREYTRLELARKLAPHADTPQQLDELLDELQRRGWLSEQRAVEQVLRVRRAKFGAAHIAHELREKGVTEELIDGALEQFKGGEFDAALAVWRKKFSALPQDARERAKQMRFLQSRGFGMDVIRRVLRHDDEQ